MASTGELTLCEPFADTLAAIRLVLGSMQGGQGPRIVLRHQLYCIIRSHSDVDRSIDEMRALGIVRVLSIPFYPKDVFITLSEHYREDIRGHYRAQEGGDTATQVMLKLLEADVTTSVGDADVHAAFESVSSGHTDEVRATASIGSRKRARSEVSGETQTRSEAERASSLRRLSAFLLPRRDVQTDHMYYYTHPQMGLLIKWIENTREGLTRALKRCSNSECAESRFRISKGGIQLKTSPLGWRFHLYDAIGSERVERCSVGGDTAAVGPLPLFAQPGPGLAMFIRLARA